MRQYVIHGVGPVLIVTGLLVFPAASTAQDVTVEYQLDAGGNVHERSNVASGVEAAPIERRRVTYTRIVVPREEYRARTQLRDDYIARTEPRGEPIYTYRAQAERPWYGDTYTDDWMYSLKSYSLGDDYRLQNQKSATADVGPQVYGYVESESPEETAARQVSGEVTELSIADTSPVPRLEIVVRTDEGLFRRVLLGTVQDARTLSLSLGDRVTAAGEPRLIGDESMLVATRLERTRVRVGGVMTFETAPRVAPEKWYHGTIVRTRAERFVGRDQDQLLATILLDDGSIVQADLGPAERLPVHEIQPQDRVTLQGRVRQSASGEPVLVVSSMRLESETVRINR